VKNMRIMHICLIGPFSDNWGYQENLLSKYHRKMGNDVSLVASTYSWGTNGDYIQLPAGEYINDDGVHVYRLANKGNTTIDSKLKYYVGLTKVLHEYNPDILFIHDVQFLDIKTIVKYLKTHPKVTVFVDNHADFSNSAKNWLSKNILHKIIWKSCAQKILPYTAKFYGVLPGRVDFLVDLYSLPKEKCELLVMGGDDELIESAAAPESINVIKRKCGLSPNDFVIVTGGKIDAYKTQTFLLMEAVKQIDNPSIKLIVFGSVSEDFKSTMDSIADGERVKYIGWVQARDSYQYFAAADLVVFPGRHSVFWEQVAAQGIPMICKRWDGTTHVDLGGNVIFLEKDSVEEIKENLERLINSPEEYQAMKNVAVEKGKKRFSYKDIAMRSIYSNDILSGHL